MQDGRFRHTWPCLYVGRNSSLSCAGDFALFLTFSARVNSLSLGVDPWRNDEFHCLNFGCLFRINTMRNSVIPDDVIFIAIRHLPLAGTIWTMTTVPAAAAVMYHFLRIRDHQTDDGFATVHRPAAVLVLDCFLRLPYLREP